MASTGTPSTPFFGSKISLISKSEIRYEGLLYAIDAKESTIALAKVKSFGSEDRIVDRPVPPRDDIFQLIIFRASDIKDLIVDDPTPQSTASALADPAIVQAHATSSTTSFPSSFPQPSSVQVPQQTRKNEPASQGTGGQASGESANKSKSAAATVLQGLNKQTPQPKPQQTASGVQQQQQQPHAGGNRQHISAGHKPQQPQQPQQQQQASQPQQQQNFTNQQGGGQRMDQRQRDNNNMRRNQNQMGNRDYQQRNGNFSHQQGGGGFRSYNQIVAGGGGGNRSFQPGGGDRRQHNGVPGGFNRGPRNGLRGSMGGPYRGGPGGFQSTGIKFANTPLPDSDFDFEKAQQDFKSLEDKLADLKLNGAEEGEVVDEVQREEEDHKDPAYNKSKSFFDTISCEALEREKGPVQRVDWKNERKMNRETFGLISQPRSNYYNRGNNRYGGFRNNMGGGGFRTNMGGGGGFRRGPGGYQNQNQNRGPRQHGDERKSSGVTSTTTTNGTTTASGPVKTNGVTSSSSNAASSAAILAAVTGGNVVAPAKN